MSSEDYHKELKRLLEKEHGREVTDEEVQQASDNLAALADIFIDSYFEDKRRKKKLEEFPKGFVLESHGYSCAICHSGTPIGENWYDKYGIKCSICQVAINKKVIPASLAKNKDDWYTKYDIESRFNIKGAQLTKFIKEGILKPRTIINAKTNRVHVHLFLIKDNKDTLPPKKLTESKMVRIDKEDGSIWHRHHSWYEFGDPYETLKGYKIMDYLKVIPANKE